MKTPKEPFEPPEGVPAVDAWVHREVDCHHCGEQLQRHDPCVWVPEHGIFHLKCIKRPS